MRTIIKYLPYVMIQLAVFFLLGICELFNADWDFGILYSASFWFNYTTTSLATLLSFFSWANLKINTIENTPYFLGMETDPKTDLNSIGNKVAIKQNTLNTLVVNHRTSDITEYLDEVNTVEKIKKFKFITFNKLFKIKSSKKWDGVASHPKVLKQVKDLETQLTDSWINENIKYKKVKYAPITEGYITNGVSYKGSTVFRQRSDSRSLRMFKDNIHRWAFSLCFVSLLSSVTFTMAEGLTLIAIATAGFKIINCVFQAVLGISYAYKYVTDKTLYELDDRIAIMEAYMKWKIQRKGDAYNG